MSKKGNDKPKEWQIMAKVHKSVYETFIFRPQKTHIYSPMMWKNVG
jgi:hypothetical protein